MDFSSDNLISLSDSGVGSSLSGSINPVISCSENGNENALVVNNDFFDDINEAGKNDVGEVFPEEGGMGTGLLIDFSDEVQVSQPQGIFLQAEIDDTFGIFSMAQQQSSQKAVGKTNTDNLRVETETPIEDAEDEAAKLVRSFTCGRKSNGVKVKKNIQEKEKKKNDQDDKSTNKDSKDILNDSVKSIGSEQTTIVESDDDPSHALPDEEEKGIMEEKMNNTSTSSNISGGSDNSGILDIPNLSSFSIPDEGESIDENKFIEDIKREDMASSSTTKAIVNKIKLEMMEDEVDDEDDKYLARARTQSKRFSEHDLLLSDLTRPTLANSTTTTRLSTASVTSSCVSSSSRQSTRSRRSSISNFGDAPVSTSSFLYGTEENGLKKNPTIPTSIRPRLSSCNFGSPIRSSYPISKFFMPTPKAKTPSTAASVASRVGYRDKLSESLYSPSRTRVMLITGDSHRSPSRVPVRKSISVETLHYEYNSHSPVRDVHRPMVKFSTPAASNKSRHSFGNHSTVLNHPNFFGDDLPVDIKNSGDHDITLTDNKRTAFMEPRMGRLSFATSASNNSINTLSLSPPGSSMFSRDLSILSSQMNRMDFGDSPTKSIATVQPVRVTAIIAPNTKPVIKPPAVGGNGKPGLIMPSKIKLDSQSGTTNRHVTASSPRAVQSSASNQTTPSRSKYANSNIRSSGYGAQQNLNSTFGSTQPLQSPNKATANIKAPAIPKSLKTGVLSLNSKLELGTRGGGATTTRTAVSALKPGVKLPTVGTTGLRRPATTGTHGTGTSSSTSGAGNNKENRLRPTVGSRIGMPRQVARQ